MNLTKFPLSLKGELQNHLCDYSKCFPTKDEAIKYGKNLAKKAGLGQLKIHKKNGTFQTEYTYENDPFPPEG